LNIDASYVMNGTGTAGAVLRNAKGEVLGGMACPLDNLLSATTAEAYALLKGLEFLDRIGCSSCYVESDSFGTNSGMQWRGGNKWPLFGHFS
jgi:ribonuclease HI